MTPGFRGLLPPVRFRADHVYVAITGAPGAGKSTLGLALAKELTLPYLAHDVIKERLADSLGTGDDRWTSQLGDAADGVFFALLPALPSAVLDHWWRPPRHERIRALDLPIVEVFCSCPVEVLQARADARATEQSRHPIHRDWLCPDVGERWAGIPSALEPLGLGPVIEVRTDTAVDIPAVTREVRALLRRC